MALTAADRGWLRKCVRETLEEIMIEQLTRFGGELSDRLDVICGQGTVQLGGYDGGISVDDEYSGEDRRTRRKRAVLGFHSVKDTGTTHSG